jgi:allophanate hydrolase subunit 2
MSLAVEFVGPGVTVQDRGRPGFMHLGVPRGGPLDPDLFERVRSSLGNAPEAAALEIPWHRARFRALHPLVVSVDGEVRALAAGEVLEVPPAPYAVRYLGLRGGIDVPVALGARGTLLVASLGGHDGRMLQRGDILRADTLTGSAPAAPHALAPTAHALAVHPLDDAPAGCLDALLRNEFTVRPQVDRVGMRLAGDMPAGSNGHGASTPLVRGAIEVTPDGGLIVMGPDHPTTGGYPVVAVVAHASQGALAQRRPGAAVRFTRA